MKALFVLNTVCFLLCTAINREANIKIKIAKQLLGLFDAGSSTWSSTNIMLDNDIDFSTDGVFSAPLLGIKEGSEQECVLFSGTLNGNGFKIIGLNISSESNASLFCGLSEATIENLVFDSTCFFQGKGNIGALSAEAKDLQVLIKNVTNHTNIFCQANENSCYISGLIGFIENVDLQAKYC